MGMNTDEHTFLYLIQPLELCMQYASASTLPAEMDIQVV